jgi:hypothetical protein
MGSIGFIGDMGFIPDIGSIGFIVNCLVKLAGSHRIGPAPNFERILNLFEGKGWYLYKANH